MEMACRIYHDRIHRMQVGEIVVEEMIICYHRVVLLMHVHAERIDADPVWIWCRHASQSYIHQDLLISEPVSLHRNCFHKRSLSNLEFDWEGLLFNTRLHVGLQLCSCSFLIEM